MKPRQRVAAGVRELRSEVDHRKHPAQATGDEQWRVRDEVAAGRGSAAVTVAAGLVAAIGTEDDHTVELFVHVD
jgi:hypothetical protein